MKKYVVELIKIAQYIVEAEDEYEAEKFAIELDSDKEAEVAWALMPYDEINIEERR